MWDAASLPAIDSPVSSCPVLLLPLLFNLHEERVTRMAFTLRGATERSQKSMGINEEANPFVWLALHKVTNLRPRCLLRWDRLQLYYIRSCPKSVHVLAAPTS
jgi:hypothetical protein